MTDRPELLRRRLSLADDLKQLARVKARAGSLPRHQRRYVAKLIERIAGIDRQLLAAGAHGG